MNDRRRVGCAAALRHLAAWLLRRRRLFVVEGESMAPTLHHGDLVLAKPGGDRPVPGDIVVARDPDQPSRYLIKRVRSRGDHTVSLGSDDPNVGRDSRTFGPVALRDVLGRVVLRVPNDGRPQPL